MPIALLQALALLLCLLLAAGALLIAIRLRAAQVPGPADASRRAGDARRDDRLAAPGLALATQG
ncbi:MAG: hypothetical protein IPG96_18375 [Proteobacteria bacterium]|nr:hypothetical protein [Pseudomonadota bacterium]